MSPRIVLVSRYRGWLSEFSCKLDISALPGWLKRGEEETKVNLLRAVIRLIRRIESGQDLSTDDRSSD